MNSDEKFEELYLAKVFKTETDIPACDESQQNNLVFILDTEEFKYCLDSDEWQLAEFGINKAKCEADQTIIWGGKKWICVPKPKDGKDGEKGADGKMEKKELTEKTEGEV